VKRGRIARVTSAHAQVATRFLSALEVAAKTGDWDGVYPLLTPDVEWVMPKRTLSGIEEVRNDLTWASPPEHMDIEFDVGELEDLGGDRVAVEVQQVYRMKGTGDFAYHRMLRIELDVGDEQVRRYEMRVVG
jgi:hypothetical protein